MPLVRSAVPTVSVRIAARAIDSLVLAAVGWALGLAIGFGFGWLVALAPLVLAYFVLGDALGGATPGKALLGLSVVDARGQRPSPRAALAREWFVLLGAVPFVGPLLALAAWIALFRTIRRSPEGQGWHDRLAGGTRVVARASSR